MIIKTIDDAIDILEDFIDELDERYGIGMFTYGEDACDAVRLMREWRIEEFKKKIKVGGKFGND
jgi:hypothetical protein